jgi:stage II sporulation SpoM-like protein
MLMAHCGSRFALHFRDSLVERAHSSDPISRADEAGRHFLAAALDFSRNLGMAAIPETIGGLALVLPPSLAAYRGWVGGIVSVDGHHQSRLTRWRSASYYLVVMALQLSAFTLAGGAGLHLGWSYLKGRGPFVGPSWFRLPKSALIDVARIYALIVPLFAAGSLLEFLWPAS